MADNNVQIEIELITKAFESALREASKSVDGFGETFADAEKDGSKALDKLGKTGKETGEEVAKGAERASTAWDVFRGVIGAEALIGAFGVVKDAASALFNTFVVDGVKGAEEAEASLKKLQTALAISGDGSQAALEDFQAFANQMQKNTTADGDNVLSQLALAKAYGLSNEQAKNVVKTAYDMAAALGIDADTAVKQLSESFTGQAGRLSKLNPVIKDLTAEQLKAGAAQELLAAQFGGAGAGKLQTFSGIVTQTKNVFGDLQEEIGFLITQNPALITAIGQAGDLFKQATQYVSENGQAIKDLISGSVVLLVTTLQQAATAGQEFAKFLVDNEQLIKAFGVGVGAAAAAFGVYALAVNASAIATGIATAAQTAFTAVLVASPVGLAVAAIGALAAGVYILANNWDFVTAKMGEFAASAITLITPAITTILDTIRPLVAIFSDTLTDSIDQAKETLTEQADELLGLQGEAEANAQLQAQAALDVKVAAAQQANTAISADTAQAAAVDLQTLQSKLAQESATQKAADAAALADDKARKKALEDQAKAAENERKATNQKIKAQLAADDAAYQKQKDQREEEARVAQINRETSLTDALIDEHRQRNSYDQSSGREKIANFKSTLDSISALQQSSSKELFEVGKAAAIAQATINTFQAASIALASAPPPFNYALAAAVTVAGLLNVQKISQTKAGNYADGGIVPGTSYSGDRLQANVNSSEMILNRSQQSRLFEMANGGGGGTNNAVLDKLDSLASAIFGQPVVVQIDGETIATAVRTQVRGGFSIGGT